MKTILIVDDDKNFVSVVDYILTTEGFNTKIAYDGHIAMKLLKDIPPDLVLLDIFMPNMDGLELIQHIRKYNKNLKIISMSGMYIDDMYLQMSTELGADDFLQKPFESNLLIAKINSNLIH